MYLVVSLILGLFLAATVFDRLLREEDLQTWRDSSSRWWSALGEVKLAETLVTANRWFAHLFDAIYGERMWSWKRLYRSVLSSYLAVAFLSWLVSGDDPLGDGLLVGGVALAVVFGVLNVVPDYFSLQETRWILRRSMGKGPLGIAFLAILDLLLTAVIFVVLALLVFTLAVMAVIAFGEDRFELSQFSNYAYGAVYVGLGLSPLAFLSTFFMSFLWISFLASAVFVRLLQKLSPFLRTMLEVIAKSETPARTTAGFLSVFLVFLYGSYRLVGLLVA